MDFGRAPMDFGRGRRDAYPREVTKVAPVMNVAFVGVLARADAEVGKEGPPLLCLSPTFHTPHTDIEKKTLVKNKLLYTRLQQLGIVLFIRKSK